MLQGIINATEVTDLRGAEIDLRQRCEQAGVDPIETEQLIAHMTDVLAELLEEGNQLVAAGKQLRVVRKFRIGGHNVQLVFRTTGSRPNLLERLFSWLFS